MGGTGLEPLSFGDAQTKFRVISKFLLHPIFLHTITICSSLPIFKPKIFLKKNVRNWFSWMLHFLNRQKCGARTNSFPHYWYLTFHGSHSSLWVTRTKLRYGFVIKCFVTTLTVFITVRSSKSSTVWVSGVSEKS